MRKLTQGEVDLVKSVFFQKIDTSKVRISNEKWQFFQPNDTVMAPQGNVHYPPGHWGYAADISKENGSHRALLIHEMTHVYQYQSGVNVVWNGIWQREYNYMPLDGSTKWSDLGIEQQADLVQDYYKLREGIRFKVTENGKKVDPPPMVMYTQIIPWLMQARAGRAA